jgi:PilZ domain
VSKRTISQAMTANELVQQRRTDRRRAMRHTITLPVQVTGFDSGKCQWHEVAETVNVSSVGIALRMSKRVMVGDRLHVEVPIPARLRQDRQSSQTYKSYATVQYVEVRADGRQIVRLQFVGGETP